MADVQDLFVERVEGEQYLFEDEWRPLEVTREEIVVKGRSEPVVLEVRGTHHGPIVNEALGADEGEPLALRWQTSTNRRPSKRCSSCRDHSGPELVAKLEGHTSPASNMVWADASGSIGYKLIGRLPIRRGGCPDLPKPGWSGEFEWEGTVPYDELPEVVDPECGYLITANNRIVGDDYPHHITSDWLDGFRAKRIEDMLEATEKHDLESFEAIQNDNFSLPGAEAARRGSAGCAPAANASAAPWSVCAAGTAGSVRRRSPARSTRPSCCGWRGRSSARDRGPGPLRALARPRRQRLPAARNLALALAFAPDGPLGGRRRGAGRPALGRAGAGSAGRRPRRPRRALRPRPRGLALGPGPRDEVSAPARRRQPAASTACSIAASVPAAPRRRSARSPTTPTTPTTPSGRRAGG